MKILITEFMEVKCVEVLKINFDVTVDHDLSANSNELKKIISKFDALIVRNKTQVSKEILQNANKLKFIGRLGVGLDNIDTEYCKNNNIHVQPATGMNADSVAEYVINSALSLLKNIPIANTETQKGNWPRNSIISRELKDKTIGIITNVRPDHLDEMGYDLDSIASSLSNTIPFNSILINMCIASSLAGSNNSAVFKFFSSSL